MVDHLGQQPEVKTGEFMWFQILLLPEKAVAAGTKYSDTNLY